MGGSWNGDTLDGFIWENQIKMDDLGVPPFQETSICFLLPIEISRIFAADDFETCTTASVEFRGEPRESPNEKEGVITAQPQPRPMTHSSFPIPHTNNNQDKWKTVPSEKLQAHYLIKQKLT